MFEFLFRKENLRDLSSRWVLAVDFLAMSNLNNTDHEIHIGDRIDDPIDSLADSIFIIMARKFFTTGWPRIGGKIPNALDDSKTVFLGG